MFDFFRLKRLGKVLIENILYIYLFVNIIRGTVSFS